MESKIKAFTAVINTKLLEAATSTTPLDKKVFVQWSNSVRDKLRVLRLCPDQVTVLVHARNVCRSVQSLLETVGLVRPGINTDLARVYNLLAHT